MTCKASIVILKVKGTMHDAADCLNEYPLWSAGRRPIFQCVSITVCTVLWILALT